MAKKLSDINLQGDRRKTEKMYERALGGGEGSSEASRQLEKPRFKSFLQDIIDKRNSGVGRGGALVKDSDPEPEIIKEELRKTAEKLQDILRVKRSNERLRSKLENAKRVKPPGDTPVKRRGLGKLAAGAAIAPAFNMLGLLGTLAKIGLLEWLSDIKNMEVLKDLVKILGGVVKLFGTSFKNIGEGWAKLTGDGTLIERLAGFFELLTGLTLLKWLIKPGTLFKDLKFLFKGIKKMPEVIKNMMGKNANEYTKQAFKKQVKNLFPQVFKNGMRNATKRAFLKILGKHGYRFARAIINPIKNKLAKSATMAATKRVVKTVGKRALSLLGKIPGFGTIIDILVRWLVFKEDLDEAAFRAAGGAMGSALFGTIGSVIPFFGTWVGLTAGYLVGEWFGDWLHKSLFGDEKMILPWELPQYFKVYRKQRKEDTKDSLEKLDIGFDRNKYDLKGNNQWWDFLDWFPDPSYKLIPKELTNNNSDFNQAYVPVKNDEISKASKMFTINKKIDKNNQSSFVATAIISNNTSNNIGISTGPITSLNNSSENELQPAAV